MNNQALISLALDELTSQRQVREHMTDAGLKALALSIKAVGQLQPIRVRRVGNEWVVLDGHRRLAAARLAGLISVTVVVDENPLNESDVIQRQLIANCQREDLAPLETARAIERLMKLSGWNASQAAAGLAFSPAKVTRLLALLNLPPSILEQVVSGKIGASAAYELTRVTDPTQQAELAARLAKGQLTRDALSGARKAKPRASAPDGQSVMRVTAQLGANRSLTVTSGELTLERFIEVIEELLAKARRGRTQGLELKTFIKMLRDQSRATAT